MTLNIIPTVYSFVFPEVKHDFDALRGRENLGELYERAWTKRQDPMHFKLMETWQEWTKDALNIDWKAYAHNYACAGSSEAIRASIATHTDRAELGDRSLLCRLHDQSDAKNRSQHRCPRHRIF